MTFNIYEMNSHEIKSVLKMILRDQNHLHDEILSLKENVEILFEKINRIEVLYEEINEESVKEK